MKEKKKVPELRFKEFEAEWRSTKLSDLLEFKNGINATKEQYGFGYKFINVLDILNNDFITHDSIIGSVNVDEETANKYPVNYGDILFQRSSETREEVGTASVYLDKEHTATFGGFVIRGRKIGEYDPMFFNKLLKTDLSRDAITSRSGGSTRYNVGQETLSAVSLYFPSVSEQQKIASFLTAIDEKLKALKKKKSLLEAYKKGVMQQIFSQELRFKDENGKDFPDWEEKRLGEIGSSLIGLTYSPDDVVQNGGVLILRSSNIKDGRLVFNDNVFVASSISKKNFVKTNDILICARNGSKGLIGKSALIREQDESYAFGAFMAIYRSRMNSYLFHVFNSPIFFKQVNEHLGATINQITNASLNSFIFPIPSELEQVKIATFLSAIDKKISCCASQIDSLENWKKGLLQRMFV